MATAPSTNRPEVLLLLSDIKEQPDEDRLRLILADWLDDSGLPTDRDRADLIRAQVGLTQLPPGHPDRPELEAQARRLVVHHARTWLGPVAPWVSAPSAVRGLWSVNARAAALGARAMGPLAGTEPWAWVEELRLSDARPADLAALRHSPMLGGLTGLSLGGAALSTGSAEVLAALPCLSRLVRLSVSGPTRDDGAVRALLASPYLGRLREVELGGGAVDRGGGRALEASALARQVTRLAVWGNHLHERALGELFGRGAFLWLSHLDLRRNQIDDHGARILAEHPGAARLRHLDLSDNRIGPRGALALARSDRLEGMRSLVLWGNPVGPAGAAALRERFGPGVHVSPAGG